VKVGVCQLVNHDVPLPLKVAALGHLTGGIVKIPEQRAYPTFCAHPDEIAAGSWTGGIREVGKRVAWVAKRALGVRTLYAVHGGLGGLGGKISPFGAVDLMVFQATLGSETIAALPATPDVGSWTSFITPPGSIKVQGSLGAYSDTIVVLSQGGGNCNRCGGLLLQGNLADSSSGGTGAATGIYRVRWVSLQDGPSVKGAPFVARDSNGREIARLSYVTKSSQNLLLYNGVQAGSWAQHQPQTFVIDVNMDTKKTTLTIDGVIKVTDTNFVQAATSFRQFAADFRGIDSGIMGWAEISITRLEDE
jgi:hypothetical protein